VSMCSCLSGHAQARDDTSRDLNPLYQQTHEAALLYGRGMRAGIDRREQKKAGAELERATVAKIRKTQARPARRARPVARESACGAGLLQALQLAKPAARAARVLRALQGKCTSECAGRRDGIDMVANLQKKKTNCISLQLCVYAGRGGAHGLGGLRAVAVPAPKISTRASGART